MLTISQLPPTHDVYGELQYAYHFLNQELFEGTLPPCIIRVNKRCRISSFSQNFWENKLQHGTTDEISFNPYYFNDRPLEETLSALAQAMVHLWQNHFGKPSRPNYHNREWANKMISIGLMPSSTSLPGGRQVGQKMGCYVVEGPFKNACDRLLEEGSQIHWVQPDLLVNESNTESPRPKRSGVRHKYECPNCDLRAWAKPNTEIGCWKCKTQMNSQETAWQN